MKEIGMINDENEIKNHIDKIVEEKAGSILQIKKILMMMIHIIIQLQFQIWN